MHCIVQSRADIKQIINPCLFEVVVLEHDGSVHRESIPLRVDGGSVIGISQCNVAECVWSERVVVVGDDVGNHRVGQPVVCVAVFCEDRDEYVKPLFDRIKYGRSVPRKETGVIVIAIVWIMDGRGQVELIAMCAVPSTITNAFLENASTEIATVCFGDARTMSTVVQMKQNTQESKHFETHLFLLDGSKTRHADNLDDVSRSIDQAENGRNRALSLDFGGKRS